MSPQSMLLECLAEQRSAELNDARTRKRVVRRPAAIRARAGRALITVGARLASVDLPATTLGTRATVS